ncbi:MAG: hypothetical protein ACI9JL_002382 [Paracoccaceae bacterium]|jgi:hypothetical protein
MRIISQPVSATQLRPVEAPQALRNRVQRDSTPEAGNTVSNGANTASTGRTVSSAVERAVSTGNAATVGAGVTAQKVFHAVSGSPAEASLPEANRAYTKTDSLRFKDVPFTLRVA